MSKKMKKSELKNMVALGNAIDVTMYKGEDYEKLLKEEEHFSHIGYTSSDIGCTGLLLQGTKTGTFYVVLTRSSALWLFS